MEEMAMFGTCVSLQQARTVISWLKTDGFRSTEISILCRDAATTRALAREMGVEVMKGAEDALGWLTQIGALSIPGVDQFIEEGSTIALLEQQNRGSVHARELLHSLGIPREIVKEYQDRIGHGELLLSVACDENRSRRAARILEATGVENIHLVTPEFVVA